MDWMLESNLRNQALAMTPNLVEDSAVAPSAVASIVLSAPDLCFGRERHKPAAREPLTGPMQCRVGLSCPLELLWTSHSTESVLLSTS